MGKRPRKRIALAQNFLTSRRLACELVAVSDISRECIVYEIGPGNGIITAELARKAGRVIAIEKDDKLARRLRERFAENDRVEIVGADFLRFRISRKRYKLFANLPFNITTSVIRRMENSPNPPDDAYFVVQKEAAYRLAGIRGETLFSILAKPFFTFRVVRRLRRTDFEPEPSVDSVFLRISRRKEPLIERHEAAAFRDFVQHGFCARRPSLHGAYKRVCGYNRWRRAARELRFPVNATPTQLTVEQWIELFRKLNC